MYFYFFDHKTCYSSWYSKLHDAGAAVIRNETGKKRQWILLNLLADKKKELETYITDQKVNFKSIDSIKKLVDYYNSL